MVRRVKQVMTVDEATGEVRSMEAVYVSKAKVEPAYVKVYLDGVDRLSQIKPYCWRVLFWMLGRMPYASYEQQIEFGTAARRKAGEELDMSVGRLNHVVSDLVTAGALLRVERGLFQLNPMIFGRGEWKEIAKLRAAVEKNATDEKNPSKPS